MVGGILYSLKVAVKERWKNISLNCGKRWFYCCERGQTVNYGPSISAFSLPSIYCMERVCLFNSKKVTWAGLRSLKTGCILSFIHYSCFYCLYFWNFPCLSISTHDISTIHILLTAFGLVEIASALFFTYYSLFIFIIFWLLKAFSVGIVALLSGFV